MRLTNGPPLWAWTPIQTLLIWVSIYAVSIFLGWRQAVIAGLLVICASFVAAVIARLRRQDVVASAALAAAIAVFFAQVKAPVHVIVMAHAFSSTVWAVYLAIIGAGLITAAWVMFWLAHRAPHGWRTPMWKVVQSTSARALNPNPSFEPAVAGSHVRD